MFEMTIQFLVGKVVRFGLELIIGFQEGNSANLSDDK